MIELFVHHRNLLKKTVEKVLKINSKKLILNKFIKHLTYGDL